jgi:mannose-6-phosphate isomerase-like protein (cupin superfamily)
MPKFQQTLLVTHPEQTAFLPEPSGHRPQFLYRELNVDQATGGEYNAHVIRGSGNKTPIAEHIHTEIDFLFVYVISGEVTFEYEGHGAHTLKAGSCHVIPPAMPHSVVAWSDDLEMIEITSPGKYNTAETSHHEPAFEAV